MTQNLSLRLWGFLKALGKILLNAFIVLSISFLILRSVPGSPFDSEKEQPEHIRIAQLEKYGYEKNAAAHLGTYLKDLLLKQDLGVSLKFTDRPVKDIIFESCFYTFSLGLLALLWALLLSTGVTLFYYVYHTRFFRLAIDSLIVLGNTLPNYLLASFFVYFLSHQLRLFPTARLDTPLHYFLPVLTLAFRPVAILLNFLKSKIEEEFDKDYVKVLRAKGLKEKKIFVRHVLPNAFGGSLSLLGILATQLLTGSFITEQFFAIPGLSKHFVDSVLNRDIYLMLGVTLLFSILLLFFQELSRYFEAKLNQKSL